MPKGRSSPVTKISIDLGFAIPVGISEDAEPIRPALGHEDVAARCADDHPGLDQRLGEHRDLESRRRLGPRPFRPLDHPGEVVRRWRCIRGGQVAKGDLAADARCIARPVSQCVIASQRDARRTIAFLASP